MVISAVCFFAWLLLGPSLLFRNHASSEIYGQYMGWRACVECHEDICNGWQQTKHAKAFESLKKSKQQDLPDCIQCHVVGYDQSGGFLDEELTIELAGVQCENCHGPGKRHIHAPEKSGALIAVPSKDVCQKCHTSVQDPGFDYQKKTKSVHGAQYFGNVQK